MIAPLAEQDTSTSTFPIAHSVYLFRHRIYFIGWGSRLEPAVEGKPLVGVKVRCLTSLAIPQYGDTDRI